MLTTGEARAEVGVSLSGLSLLNTRDDGREIGRSQLGIGTARARPLCRRFRRFSPRRYAPLPCGLLCMHISSSSESYPRNHTRDAVSSIAGCTVLAGLVQAHGTSALYICPSNGNIQLSLAVLASVVFVHALLGLLGV